MWNCPCVLLARKRLVELPLKFSDAIGVERPGLGKHRLELLRPHHQDIVDGEGASDQRPVGVDEAEHTVHGNIGMIQEGRPDLAELLLHSVDQLRTVAPTHDE